MIVALAVSLLVFAHQALAAQPQAARIDRITPVAARLAERVTITGIGFGASNVRITVGGISARVVSATGNQVTFVVPAGLVPGFARVTATNPGGQTGNIGFTFLEGILLSGGLNTSAISSTFDLPPVGVDPNVIVEGVILTRLEVWIETDATVGQVNAALAQVGGGIVSMSQGFAAFTIAIPQPPNVEALVAEDHFHERRVCGVVFEYQHLGHRDYCSLPIPYRASPQSPDPTR